MTGLAMDTEKVEHLLVSASVYRLGTPPPPAKLPGVACLMLGYPMEGSLVTKQLKYLPTIVLTQQFLIKNFFANLLFYAFLSDMSCN
jgi:hypothetical protein